MARKLPTFKEFFERKMKNPRFRRAYREVVAEELGEALRSLRDQRGVTQQKLARLLGKARSRISQIEGAEGLSLSLETIARYANALGYRLELHFVDKESGEVAARYFLDHMNEIAEATPWHSDSASGKWVVLDGASGEGPDEFGWAA